MSAFLEPRRNASWMHLDHSLQFCIRFCKRRDRIHFLSARSCIILDRNRIKFIFGSPKLRFWGQLSQSMLLAGVSERMKDPALVRFETLGSDFRIATAYNQTWSSYTCWLGLTRIMATHASFAPGLENGSMIIIVRRARLYLFPTLSSFTSSYRSKIKQHMTWQIPIVVKSIRDTSPADWRSHPSCDTAMLVSSILKAPSHLLQLPIRFQGICPDAPFCSSPDM